MELRDALAFAKHCRNVKAIPGATNSIMELALLVAEGATLIDEYLKHSAPGMPLSDVPEQREAD